METESRGPVATGGFAEHGPPAPVATPFADTLILTVAATIGAFGVFMPLAFAVVPPTEIPGPFPPQNQNVESLVFAATFAAALPLALILVPRVVRAIASGPNAAGLPLLAALAPISLAILLLLVRVSERLPWGDGVAVTLVAASAWWGLMALAFGRALRPRPWSGLLGASAYAGWTWWGAAAVTLLAILLVTHLDSISILPLGVGLLAAAAAMLVYRRGGLPRLSRTRGRFVDGAICGVLLLAVPNVVIFTPEDRSGDVLVGLKTAVTQFHQNLFLGPANEVLGGGAMLVDTVSQYGVGSIYALAAWFQVAPITYGTSGLFDGMLVTLVFIGGYLVLRMAGVSRVLAGVALGIAVIALVYSLLYPLGALLQHGGLRFGLPMAVLVAGVAGYRWPERAGLWRIGQLAVLALSSIWALEAFGYTLITFAGLELFRLWATPRAGRARSALRAAAAALGAIAIAHVLFALATLIATGELPNWGLYLEYLRSFLFGKIGILTYDFAPWSVGVAVGAVYVASVAAIVLLLRTRRDLVDRQATTMVALCGSTAYGLALFTYFVNRSDDHILPYVSLPAILLTTLWLSLLLRSPEVGTRTRLGGLAAVLAVGVLILATAWSSAGTRFPQSALAHAAPGGSSLPDALERLWNPPALSPAAPAGESLLSRYMPDERSSYVLTAPDLSVEILLRSRRSSAFGFNNPIEDGFVPYQHLPELREVAENLQGGELVLVDQAMLDEFAAFKHDPSLDVELDPLLGSAGTSSSLAPLQSWLVKRLAERFALERLGGEGGLSVVRLVPDEELPAT